MIKKEKQDGEKKQSIFSIKVVISWVIANLISALLTIFIVCNGVEYWKGSIDSDIEYIKKDIGDNNKVIGEISNDIKGTDGIIFKIDEINKSLKSQEKIISMHSETLRKVNLAIFGKIEVIPAYGGGPTKSAKMYKGYAGYITAEKDSDTASGQPYNPDMCYCAINLCSELHNVKFMETLTVYRIEFATDITGLGFGGPSVNVKVIDTFYDSYHKNRLVLLSPAAANLIELTKTKGLMEVGIFKASDLVGESP